MPADEGHKPDSVAGPRGPTSAIYLMRSTRNLYARRRMGRAAPTVPYLILLRMGFTWTAASLEATRWSLTPPFHPYLRRAAGGMSLWHFPSLAVSRQASRFNTGTSCPVESGLSSPGASARSDRTPSSADKVNLSHSMLPVQDASAVVAGSDLLASPGIHNRLGRELHETSPAHSAAVHRH